MAKLIRFKNVGYGDYKCACCNKVHLEGLYNVVGDEDDDEGFEWRGFCDN